MKRVFLALALVAALLIMVAPVAGAQSAHHATGPDSPDCSTVVFGWWGAISTHGNLNVQAFANALYDRTSNASCDTFQSGLKIWATSGSSTVTYRETELVWSPCGCQMSGSYVASATHYTQGTTPTYFYGNWVGGIPCGWQFDSFGGANLDSYLYQSSQLMSGSC
jgi:hypothetical protein